LPITFLVLRQAILEKYIHLSVFIWSGPLVVVCILGSIPVLFALGRWILRNTIKNKTPSTIA
nr:hypothetical protein [Syntrophales bacterium]